jgi:hypothetical protein
VWPTGRSINVLRNSRPRRAAFSFVHLVIVLAVVGVATGVFAIALQHVREEANRAACANNLRLLTLSVHKFHATNGTMPPYWGAYPSQDSASIKGSWFCHLLPFVGETKFYGEVMADVQKTGYNWDVYPGPAPAAEATRKDGPQSGDDPAAAVYEEVARYNGHRHWDRQTVTESGAIDPAVSTPTLGQVGGIFKPQFSPQVFALLRCPSDPSPGSYPDAGVGQVYLTHDQVWGSTNYLANWNAFANNNPQSGYLTPPQKFGTITDGLANTVLFGEGYSWCDGKGRLALNSWDYHSFGLTWALANATFDDGSGEKRVNYPNGMPNTYLFQVRPLAKETRDCPTGADCCDNWRSQTGHAVLNAAMADGSVREFARGTSQRVWDHALLPRDGPLSAGEW